MNAKGMDMRMPRNRKLASAASAVIRALTACVALVGCLSNATGQAIVHARLSATGVDNAQRIQLNGAAPLVAKYGKDLGPLSMDEPLRSMKLVLRRGAAETAALQDYLAQVQDPASSNYHAWLTPEAVGQRFGASDEDINAISSWLQQQGLTVDGVSKGRTVITFSGVESQFASAFGTQMHRYLVGGETRIANSATPTVPVALSPAIVGIATLGNAKFRPAHTKPGRATRDASGLWHKQQGPAAVTSQSGKATPEFTMQINGGNYPMIGPADFGVIYGAQSVWKSGQLGAGQSIAVVAESNIVKSDVDAFRAAFGLPATNLNVIVVGPDPGLDSVDGTEAEADLDVQWAGAIAPASTINLVVAGSTNTDEGINIAAEYAVDNNLSPVLNVSYGACELGLQAAGNQFYEDLWSQAAAQGISVMIASGDAGSTACDQGQYYASYGQQVSGLASTEHATAVGGTDFYGNVDGSSHFTLANNPVTLQSVLGYITEAPWNDSCANPLVLANKADFGLTETTSGQICSNEYAFLDTVGGSGGISLCTSSDGADQSSCTGGYPAPSWQKSFLPKVSANYRQLPDVSFFAGAGLWGSAYAYCEADAASTGDCINNNGTMTTLVAGGTSFAAPALAGVVALLNAQQGGRQGNINKYLYALAAKQFANPALSSSCQSGSTQSNGMCIFHDVITGSIAEPCVLGSLVDLIADTTCQPENAGDYVGITPGYSASVGYDAATGLGTINIANLLSNWPSVVALDASSVTTDSLIGATTVPYGTNVSANVSVKAASGNATPTGPVSLLSVESGGSSVAVATGTLISGSVGVTFNSLTPGSHQIYATYGGDATFGSSASTPTAFTITKGATGLMAVASNPTITSQNSSTVIVKVQTSSQALSPTGTIALVDQTTGVTLGSGVLTAYVDPASGNSWSQASVLISGTSLASGNNVIVASYTGDSNYLAASNQTVSVSYQPFYTLASSSSSLAIQVSQSSQTTDTITIATSNGTPVNPATLSLSCGKLPVSGLSCSFSPVTLSSSGVATSTLTLTASGAIGTPLAMNQPSKSSLMKGAGSLAFACVALLWIGRRRGSIVPRVAPLAMLIIALGAMSACSSSPKASSPAITNQLTVSSSTPAYGSALTMTSLLNPSASSAQPSGTVLFYDGASLLGSSPVSGARAVLTTSSLAVGTHALSASYSGDSTFMPSTSTAVSVNVSVSGSLKVTVSDTAGNLAILALPFTIY
jgi:subtilase family serine protease